MWNNWLRNGKVPVTGGVNHKRKKKQKKQRAPKFTQKTKDREREGADEGSREEHGEKARVKRRM